MIGFKDFCGVYAFRNPLITGDKHGHGLRHLPTNWSRNFRFYFLVERKFESFTKTCVNAIRFELFNNFETKTTERIEKTMVSLI